MFYYEPGTVEDAKEIAVKKGAKNPALMELTLL